MPSVDQDCADDWGGSAVTDECGVCDGEGPQFECVSQNVIDPQTGEYKNYGMFCSEDLCNEYILDASESIPTTFKLSQNYPNPFNPVTAINFDVPINGHVTLKIYDVLGNHVDDLVSDYYGVGRYTVHWAGINKFGSEVSSGVYIYQLQHSKGIITKKMVLIR